MVIPNLDDPRSSGLRGMALLLALLVGAPAAAGEKRPQALTWERFAQLRPGSPLVLVLRDGRRLEGRLLAADVDAAEVVDLTGLHLSGRAQKRLVRALLESRRNVPASTAEQAATPVSADAALVRRIARDQVASVHVPSGGSPFGGVLKVVAVVAGVYFLLLLSLILSCGGNSQCLS